MGGCIVGLYWPENEAIPTEYIDYENKGTFEVRGKKKYRGKEQIILWRDYTRDERVQMGEIMDVRYAAVRSFHYPCSRSGDRAFL